MLSISLLECRQRRFGCKDIFILRDGNETPTVGETIMDTEEARRAQQREKEVDVILANDELLEFMQSGLENTGDEEPEEAIIARGKEAVDAFSKQPQSFWCLR